LNRQLIEEMNKLKSVGVFDPTNCRRGKFEIVKHGIQMGHGATAGVSQNQIL
jgi:hypothetical protein